MKRVLKEKHLVSSIAVAVALAFAASVAVAQSGNKPPAAGGGGGETTVGNNLSYPALDLDPTTAAANFFFSIAANPAPELGKTFSYGCDKPEKIGTSEYPNTSCVVISGSLVTYLSASACMAPSAPCFGYPVDRIYWQKINSTDWSSDSHKLPTGETVPVPVSHVDWGDNLETKTWPSTSVLRVEVTPYASRASDSLYRGVQMWHVSGQGTDEVWGARALDANSSPYVYDSPYVIVRTPNARLNITKLQLGAMACPTTGAQGPYRTDLTWTGSGWSSSGDAIWQLRDIPFAPELNVGGKYVYGYNWQLRRDNVPIETNKAGWWRLTFYTRPTEVDFDTSTRTMAPTTPTAYPLAPALSASVLRAVVTGKGKGGGGGGGGGGGEETGAKYTPFIDTVNDITYIDICLK